MRNILAIVSCVAALLVLAARAQADLLVYDGFDYSTGPLSGDAGGVGWDPAGPWSSSSNVVAPIGSIGSIPVVGNAAQGEDYTAFGSRNFDPSLDLDAGANYAAGGPGIPYYFSFLVNFASGPSNVIDNPIQVGFSTPGNPVYVQFGAGTGSTVNMSVAADPNNATNTVALQTGTTYLITGSFNAIFSGPYDGLGQLNLSAYSDGGSIPSSAPSSWQLTYTDTSPGGYPAYNSLQLTGFGSHYSDSTGDMTLDEFRVGTDFSDVAASVPEPTCLALTCLSATLLLKRRR